MTIGILKIIYHLPYSQTLKNKRQILRSIKDILKKKFNISISEIDYMNLWQKSLIGISMISSEQSFINSNFNKIISEFECFKNGYIADYNTEYLHSNEGAY